MTTAALPRRFARPLLLLAMERRGCRHGYELFETVTGNGVQIDLAGVYRELRAMERHDLLSSSWMPSDAGPDRRVYELTETGRVATAAARAELAAMRDQLAAALAAELEPIARG